MFTNRLLRKSVRLYPFNRGRYRIMKFAERLLFPCEEETSDLHGKFRFRLDLSKGGLQRSFFYFIPEYYEPATQRYLKQNVKPNMVVMDIGAHLGLYTLLLADLVGEGGKVYSFEPAEENFRRLKEHTSINNIYCVKLFKLALSDREETTSLYINPMDDSGHSLISEQADACAEGKRVGPSTQAVQTTTLDAIINREGIDRLDLIKIDIEGAEHIILKGGEEMLSKKKAPHIICETHTTHNLPNKKKDDVREILYSYGYKSYFLDKKYLVELDYKTPVVGLQNILYIKST